MNNTICNNNHKILCDVRQFHFKKGSMDTEIRQKMVAAAGIQISICIQVSWKCLFTNCNKTYGTNYCTTRQLWQPRTTMLTNQSRHLRITSWSLYMCINTNLKKVLLFSAAYLQHQSSSTYSVMAMEENIVTNSPPIFWEFQYGQPPSYNSIHIMIISTAPLLDQYAGMSTT
jgi:hypothetical protein